MCVWFLFLCQKPSEKAVSVNVLVRISEGVKEGVECAYSLHACACTRVRVFMCA